MNQLFNKNKQAKIPVIYLGTPNHTILCAINGIREETFDLSISINDTSKISFDVDKYIKIFDKKEKSYVYPLIDILMRIYIPGIGWFLLSPPVVNNDGENEYKTISGESEEIEMLDHDIKNLKINKGTTDSYEMLVEGNVDSIDGVEFAKEQIKFCNKSKPELSFLHILLKISGLYGWTIGEIDNTPKEYLYYDNGELKKKQILLSDEIGSFDVEIQDLYSFLTQDVAQFFSCIFIFDYRNLTINAYRPDNLGKDTNINIGFRNLQQSNEISVDESNIFTRYEVYGDDELSIEYVNFGSKTIENIDYFLNEKYLSPSTIKKYHIWKQDVEKQRPIYIENTKLYNKQLSVISELKNRVPLDDCSTDWSTFEDNKLLEAQANYQAQLKGYESYYVDKDGNFDEEALKASYDANDYYQIKDVILPSIAIEISNRNLPPDKDPEEYIKTYETNWKLYGLDELEVKLQTYKNRKKVLESNGYDKSYDENKHTYDTWEKLHAEYLEILKQLDANYYQLTDEFDTLLIDHASNVLVVDNPIFIGSCQQEYNIRLDEVKKATEILNQYNEARNISTSSVQKETWKHDKIFFTDTDIVELSKLYKDGTYENNNMFLTNSDDSVSAIDEQLKLLSASQDDLYIASHPQYIYSTTLDNFISKYDYKNYVNNLNVGDYLYLGVRDDYVVKLRVTSISYNPLCMDNNLSITFSNMIRTKYGRNDSVYLLQSSRGGSKSSSHGTSGNYEINEGIQLTAGLIQKLLQSGAFSNKVSELINNEFANFVGTSISINELNAKMIKVTDIIGENGFFEYLQSKLISADKIITESAEIKKLSAKLATIDNLLAGNVSSELGHIIHLTAQNVTIDEAVIRDMIAASITVSMLKAGTISANKFNIVSDDGGMEIVGNTMQFKDENGIVRIQIGRDTTNNFTFCLYDETGKGILIDSNGIKESAISDGLIKNDMIADGSIGKEKFNFSFLDSDSNGNIVKDGKVIIDKTGIDANFVTLNNSVTNIQNQIDDLATTLPSATNVILGNESQNIPCNTNGQTLGQTLIEIPFLGYVGKEKVSVSATVGLLPNGITIATNTDATPDSDGIIILNVAENINLGGDKLLNGKIDITFSINNIDISKQFYWCKAISGKDGIVKLYNVQVDTPVLFKNSKDIISPNSITFSSNVKISNEPNIQQYLGSFIIKESIDGTIYSNKYVSLSPESSVLYTPSSNKVCSIQCILCEGNNISSELDRLTVPIISDEGIKADITEIKTQVSGVSTKVDAINKQIIDKVWQSDITTHINNYDGTTVKGLRDQITEQKTEIGRITDTVSDVQSTLSKKADGSTVQTLTERLAKAEQDANGFKQTVEQNYIQKNDLNSSARNLLRNSKTLIYQDYKIVNIK